ncbi:MAG: HD domain-containing protein [Candidatus Hodarchaeota archaeon]
MTFRNAKAVLELNHDLPSFYRALDFLLKQAASPDVVFHCLQVSMKAKELAEKLKQMNHKIDVELCTIGGLLHDMGRTVTHSLRHAIEGAELIRRQGWPEVLALTVERHIGGGIPREEAIGLGLPPKDYLPTTLEEKIVCYADKLFIYSYDASGRMIEWREVPDCSAEAQKLQKRLGGGALAPTRLLNLERELKALIEAVPKV